MAARSKPRSAAKPTGKQKAGVRKKSARAKKKKAAAGSKKSARRKAERKKKSARRRSTRSDGAAQQPAGKRNVARKKGSQQVSRTRTLRLPELIGFIAEASAESSQVGMKLERGEVQSGDAIHVLGPRSDFYARIEQLSLAGRNVAKATPGQTIAFRLAPMGEKNDSVYLLSS